jgi:class 3 adenylate cyclase
VSRGIDQWLKGLGLGRYAEAFADNEIDLHALPHITEEDLKEVGVALGARRKLLAAIAELGDLDEPSTADETSDQRSAGAEAERRQLTVMFCDLVGSTALSQRLDPEVLRDVLRSYQDVVVAAVARYEGHVAKFLGDGVLAYFGWPQAYEDQAERAVRAGLDAVAAVGGVKLDGGERLRARVGIATGQVVVGDLSAIPQRMWKR